MENLLDTGNDNPSKRLRQSFLGEMAKNGVKMEQPAGTQLYLCSGSIEGVIYLVTCAKDTPFWGLRKDYLLCLLGEGASTIWPHHWAYLQWLVSEQTGPKPKVPEGWNWGRISRRVLLLVKRKQPWCCVLLFARRDGQVCDGCILKPSDVQSGISKWSYSDKQGGDYKIHDRNLNRLPMARGLAAVVSAAFRALGNGTDQTRAC